MYTYDQIITEHFNVLDRDTRKVLISINEADKSQVLGSLAAKLYDKIVKDVTNIDYGTIPLTKGDITKMENYIEINDCLTTIRDLAIQFKQPTDSMDTVINAISNVKATDYLWKKAYGIDCEMPTVFYNSICMAIVSSTSLLIATSIEYIKDPSEGTINIVLNQVSKNKTQNKLMLDTLDKFNVACKKGEIDKIFKSVLSAQRTVSIEAVETLTEGIVEKVVPSAVFVAIGAAGTILALLKCVIPILRTITSTLFGAKQSLSDYLAIESDHIRLNAEKIQYNSAKSPEAKNRIRDKQLKIADKLKKNSDKLIISMTKAQKDTLKVLKADENEKFKLDDVVGSMPDSASSLF